MEDSLAAESVAKWMTVLSTPISTVAVVYPEFYAQLLPGLQRGYEAAGRPCGEREAEMQEWWQDQADTARVRWLLEGIRECWLQRLDSSAGPSRLPPTSQGRTDRNGVCP